MKPSFKSWQRRLLFVVSALLLLSTGLPSLAQSWDARYANSPDKAQWKWAQEPWDGDDRPFVALRAQIDRAVAGGQKPEVLLRRYKAQALKKPRDAKAQFAYGYSAYLASRAAIHDSDKSLLLLMGVPLALEQPTFPRSYQYARLKFLVQAKRPSDQRLRWAGERLVKRDPEDYLAKQRLVSTLINTTLLKKPDKEQITRLLNELIRDDPGNRATHSLQGFFYYLTSKQSRNLGEVQKAIDGYKRYLALAPKNEDFRPLAQSFIKELEKRKKEFAS